MRAFSQSKPRISTIVITFEGKSDHPVFPVVVSSSSEEAEWYKNKLFNDPVASFVHVYVVPKGVWTQITSVRMLREDVKQANPGDLQGATPVLKVVLASGHSSRTVAVEAQDAIAFLSDVRARLPEYPSLVEHLSEMQARMQH